MNESDSIETRRLCGLLEQIDHGFPISDSQRVALKKATIALSVAFTCGLRQTIEEQYSSIDQPLTEEQRRHLLSMDIGTDSD